MFKLNFKLNLIEKYNLLVEEHYSYNKIVIIDLISISQNHVATLMVFVVN